MQIAGWIIWSALLFFAVAGAIFLKRGLKAGLMGQTIATIICQWLLLAWSALMPGFNKLHIIWLFPLTYALSLPATFLMTFGKWTMLVGTIIIYCVVLEFLSP
jgi:hypothetical protein